MRLSDLPTPCLVLDRGIVQRNCERMKERARALGVSLRPHLKTAKSVEVARLAGDGAITVSTLREAEHFLERGVRDITLAVGIVPAKLPAIAELVRRGATMRIVTDDLEVARAIAAARTGAE